MRKLVNVTFFGFAGAILAMEASATWLVNRKPIRHGVVRPLPSLEAQAVLTNALDAILPLGSASAKTTKSAIAQSRRSGSTQLLSGYRF